MAMVVNSNMSSLNALNNLNRTNQGLSDTFGRISSGLRINKAADDAAGLAVAENLDAGVRSLGMAKRNANDGIAVIQVAESATNEVANVLKRMRELLCSPPRRHSNRQSVPIFKRNIPSYTPKLTESLT
jgi:flagellin